MPREPLRVAIVAPQASAQFGGESILPLHYFRQLRERGVDAWMVLHERTREELENVLGEDIERVLFVKDLLVDRLLYRLSCLLPPRVGENTFGLVMFYLTQWRQNRVLRQLVRQRGVNVVHQPSPVSPKIPSLISNVGAPVIIGPMNGGMTFPPSFRHLQRASERFFVGIARRTTAFFNLLLPGKRRAALLVVANRRTLDALPVRRPERVVELVENGVDFRVFDGHRAEAATRRKEPVSLVFLGRLVDWKAVDLLLEVLAQMRDLPFVLRVIGDGPERSKLEELSSKLGLESHVLFHGFLPQTECANWLSRADVLVLPSLYECGGAVVLEAMAMGLPVVAHRWGGPADYLDETCGFLLDPCQTPTRLQADWVATLRRLVEDPELRERLGRSGRERARARFSWNTKIDSMLALYERARTNAES